MCPQRMLKLRSKNINFELSHRIKCLPLYHKCNYFFQFLRYLYKHEAGLKVN